MESDLEHERPELTGELTAAALKLWTKALVDQDRKSRFVSGKAPTSNVRNFHAWVAKLSLQQGILHLTTSVMLLLLLYD